MRPTHPPTIESADHNLPGWPIVIALGLGLAVIGGLIVWTVFGLVEYLAGAR